jgi:hypothetical protein
VIDNRSCRVPLPIAMPSATRRPGGHRHPLRRCNRRGAVPATPPPISRHRNVAAAAAPPAFAASCISRRWRPASGLTDYAWSRLAWALAAELPGSASCCGRRRSMSGDRATLPLLRYFLQPLVILPVAPTSGCHDHVADLAAAIAALAAVPACPAGPFGFRMAPPAAMPGRISWRQRSASRRRGKSCSCAGDSAPGSQCGGAARLTGAQPILSPDKHRAYHRDWVTGRPLCGRSSTGGRGSPSRKGWPQPWNGTATKDGCLMANVLNSRSESTPGGQQ